MNWKIRYNYQKNGFTLVELAVVMVIIGLVVGGIMLGQTMIKSSNIRSVIAQVEQFKTASNTFKTKYNCMAGDCAYATSLLTGTANGNGNNRFDGGGARHTDNEVLLFWQHLSYAQLIPR
jgi:prepilin-type N-terminal cleavage/methylation domain-containing protein